MNDCTSQDHNRGPTLILMILAPELQRDLPCKVPTSAREAPRQLARPSVLQEVSLYLQPGVLVLGSIFFAKMREKFLKKGTIKIRKILVL